MVDPSAGTLRPSRGEGAVIDGATVGQHYRIGEPPLSGLRRGWPVGALAASFQRRGIAADPATVVPVQGSLALRPCVLLHEAGAAGSQFIARRGAGKLVPGRRRRSATDAAVTLMLGSSSTSGSATGTLTVMRVHTPCCRKKMCRCLPACCPSVAFPKVRPHRRGWLCVPLRC
jgi:hypothetical protein